MKLIAPAIAKGDDKLRAYLDSKIEEISKNGALKAAYQKTLLPVFGDKVPASEILVDGVK